MVEVGVEVTHGERRLPGDGGTGSSGTHDLSRSSAECRAVFVRDHLEAVEHFGATEDEALLVPPSRE